MISIQGEKMSGRYLSCILSVWCTIVVGLKVSKIRQGNEMLCFMVARTVVERDESVGCPPACLIWWWPACLIWWRGRWAVAPVNICLKWSHFWVVRSASNKLTRPVVFCTPNSESTLFLARVGPWSEKRFYSWLIASFSNCLRHLHCGGWIQTQYQIY